MGAEAVVLLNSVTSTCLPTKRRKTVWFSQMSLEDLRELMKFPSGNRAQILALLHNRYPCGYMYVYEDETNASFIV